MTRMEADPLLELHRQLCAAVRSADQAFARLYVADSASMKQHEGRYLVALSETRAALCALERAYPVADRPDAAEFGAAVAAARNIC